MNKETDISQIYKYLNGELDAKAMHQLEKRALDDPFLMDALEGYETSRGSQHAQLAEISQRLKERISGSEKRIVPWHYFAIAASVLVVATIGGVLVFNQKTAKPQLAKIIVPATQQAPVLPGKVPVINNEIADEKATPPAIHTGVAAPKYKSKNYAAASENTAFAPPVVAADAVAVEPRKNSDNVADKDSMPLNEMIVTEYTSGKKKDLSQNVVSTNVMRIKKADTSATQLLPAQAIGAAFNNVTPLHQGYLPVPQPNNAGNAKEATGLEKEYQASKNAGSGVAANFKSRKAPATNSDSVKTSSSNFINNSLAEVVVAAPAPEEKRVKSLAAHPQKGWESFKKYLEDSAVSPDKKTGKVTVSFSVDQNGVISNLQIVSGLSDATNQKALYLISNGPGWVGNTNGLPENVKVKIQFTR